ncbi:MAG TPA: helix-turn-helix transcriptional regulator [Terriglobales bacterium]
MATTLAPVEDREVVRCDHCHLVQFRTSNNLCRKCRTSLDEDEPEPILVQPLPVMEPAGVNRSEVQVAQAIRSLRLGRGLSQRQLALRMGVPRTYVSKIENEKATPTLSSLARLAEALTVSVPELLRACAPSRQHEIDELMADPFIAEMAVFTKQLDDMQRTSVLAQIRDLVSHPRRIA